jgi:hypothetical protein
MTAFIASLSETVMDVKIYVPDEKALHVIAHERLHNG